MDLIGGLLRLFRGLVTLAILVGIAGLVAWAVLPGGPLADGGAALDGGERTDAGVGTVATGPTATPPPAPSGTGPWDEAMLTVAVRNRAAPERNVTAPVADALDYWEHHIGYADYAVEFRVANGAADPDIVVWYNETLDCPGHGDAIGCAPLLEADSRIDRPVPVRIRYDPADNRRQVEYTAIHEFGHVLGLGHCEEPHWVMASACEEPLPDAPDADRRALAWLDRNLTVYVDDRAIASAERAGTADQVGHAVDYLSNRSDGAFPTVRLRRVEDRFAADLVVTFFAEDGCRGDGAACYSTRGRDVDGDGAMEYYTGATIRVSADTDVEARGWFVGWGLANAISPPNVPPVFEGATYEERRSRWWE